MYLHHSDAYLTLACLAANICQSRAFPGTITVRDHNGEISDSVAPGAGNPAVPLHTTHDQPVPRNAKNTPSQCDDEILCQSDDSMSETDFGMAKKWVGRKKNKGKGVNQRSEYERERDENIARNKAILTTLNEEWKGCLNTGMPGKTGEPSDTIRTSGSSTRFVDLLYLCFSKLIWNLGSDAPLTTSRDALPTAIFATPAQNAPDSTFDTLFMESEKAGNPNATVVHQPTVGVSGTDEVDGTVTLSETIPLLQIELGVSWLDRRISDAICWPSWLSSAVKYLKGISMSPEWVALVTKLVDFEEVLGFHNMVSLISCRNALRTLMAVHQHGRLDCVNRPEVVHIWLKNGRKYTAPPKITNVVEYNQSWWKWWKMLQPEWWQTTQKNNVLSHKVPESGEEWSRTCQGGTNGFYMIIPTLAWWVAEGDQNLANVKDADLHLAIDDTSWVLERMILVLNSRNISTKKHSLDDVVEDMTVRKRWL